MTRRLGILGGTFDPVHCGHLDLGDAAQRALSLTTLTLIASHQPPHRAQPAASSFHRFAMLALAVADRPGWQTSDSELRRPEFSYTSETLQRLRAEGWSQDELFFVIGADAFGEIRSWKSYPELLSLCHFAAVSRPGHPVGALPGLLPELAPQMIAVDRSHPDVTSVPSIFLIDAPTADVSATAIRERCSQNLSIRGLVPASVEQHIERHGLYAHAAGDAQEREHEISHTAGRLHGQS